MALVAGTRLGPYEVLSSLGAGGMGEVYRAHDSRLKRDVAVKVLPEALWHDSSALSRFETEARAVAALSHPNILAIHDFGTAEGVPYAVMELLEGRNLREEIGARPLPVRRAVDYALQVALGLSAAHERGIVHRDLKPENIFVTSAGQVKILDFGLARRVEPVEDSDVASAPTTHQQTQPGTVLGTVGYMSPEQVKGLPVDARSDIFSFGTILYEMLSGRRAFQGNSTAETLVTILSEEPPELSRPDGVISPALERIVRHCLAKSPEARFQSARDVVFALEELASGVSHPSRTTLVMTWASAASFVRRHGSRRALLAGGVVVAVAAGAAWLALRARPSVALPSPRLVAILPATDLTGLPDGRRLCDGVSFSLGVKLQRVRGITVLRPSRPALLDGADLATWARDTGANILVQPAVRQVGAMRQLSFSIELAGSPVQIAAGEVTGPSSEHLRLEDELTRELAEAIQVHLATGEAVRTSSPPIPPGPSQTDYVVALGYLEHYDDFPSVKRAVIILQSIPGGDRSAEVQAALGRAYLAAYTLSKDVSSAALASKSTQKAIELAPDLPEAQVTLGELLTATGRAAEAIPILKEAVKADGGSIPARLALSSALQRSGDVAGAVEQARRLVELRPTSPVAVNRLGICCFMASRYEDAASAFRKAIALDPDVPRAHLNLGAALLRLGRFDEARSALEETIRVEPVPQAYSNLGVAQYLLGRYAEAASSFQRAVELAPNDHRWHVYLGDALSQLPERAADARRAYQDALPLVRAALSVDPSDAVNVVLLGRCLARTGDPSGAWREIRRGVALAPEDEDVIETAAAAAMLVGRQTEALEWLEKAVARGYGTVEIERDPDFAPLRGKAAFQKLLEPPPTGAAAQPKEGEER